MSTSYKHFSTEERESLLVMLTKNMKMSEIAKALGRSESTISRELKRNRSEDGSYSPSKATKAYYTRRTHCRRKRKLDEPHLRAAVEEKLKQYWSPEQIAGRLKLETGECRISYPTIYRAYNRGEIDVQKECFRRKRRPNTPHSTEKRGRIHDYRPINSRPKAADEKSQIGHWEGDTVRGALGKGVLSTFVDRKSKFLVSRLMPDRKASTLNLAAEAAFTGFPKSRKRSFTMDHGNEFFSHKDFEERIGTKVYFADPYSPWQRGLNENTNGLLRQYFPKKFDFLSISQSDLDRVVTQLNMRPRKSLGFRSPFEIFFHKSLHLY